MGLFQKLFGNKEEPINTYADFWNWFAKHEQRFHQAIQSQSQKDIVERFFKKLEPALAQVKPDIYYLAGMYNNDTAELVLSAEGAVKNIVFVEELVAAAPPLKGWKFTALKPVLKPEDANIEMNGFRFSTSNIHFYPNVDPRFPDQVDITIVHDDYSEANKEAITNGVYVFLDNLLGELHFAATIDNLEVTGKKEAQQELIPTEKLSDYLLWRQKEFVEKYEGITYDPAGETYGILEAKLQSGFPLIAAVNSKLLEWHGKASHPWIAIVEIEYDGSSYNGLPVAPLNEPLDKIEDEITEKLKQSGSNLNIGRQSANNVRKIFYACKDFRYASKVIYETKRRYAGKTKMSYRMYKDKYWQTLDHFRRKEH